MDESEYVTIAIGRNIGNDNSDKLSNRQWDNFRLAVNASFRNGQTDFHVTGNSWSGEHGVEETYIAGGYVATTVSDIRAWLATIAARYGQTAISLNIGGERIEAITHNFPGYGASCRRCRTPWHPIYVGAPCGRLVSLDGTWDQ